LIRHVVLQTATAEAEMAGSFAIAPSEKTAGPRRQSGQATRFAWSLAAAAGLIVLVTFGALYFRSHPATPTIAPPNRSTGTGSILYEYWTGISGQAVADLTAHPDFQRAPTGRAWLPQFEAPSNRGDDYGARLRGYLYPPVSGPYLFWIASDDASELWLSEDENPANKRRIGFVESWVPAREWNWQPSQQSPSIHLEAGRRYYIEALHKQGTAADSLAVAWQTPGGELEIIPGRALAPIAPRP
jgi:hypothetical protein